MYERSRKVSRKGSENLDKHLLEALYHRYYKELYIFVYSLCGSETVTDDILQDTFFKSSAGIERFSHQYAGMVLYGSPESLL